MQQLSPEGARLVRAAREAIKKRPGSFNMRTFFGECGTTCCIGGHMAVAAGIAWIGQDGKFNRPSGWREALNARCGFASDMDLPPFGSWDGDGLGQIFFGWNEGHDTDVSHAVERINAFLFKYGYPPDEISGQEITDDSCLSGALIPVLK